MSRSRPEDKYALVVGLIERGNVVAAGFPPTTLSQKHSVAAKLLILIIYQVRLYFGNIFYTTILLFNLLTFGV